jgi:hypothetical protein
MNVNAFKFRKKPVVIEAFRWDGEQGSTYASIFPKWFVMATKIGEVKYLPMLEALEILTLEGKMRAERGDWIIRGVKGELYPCKPDIFAATYESADIDLNAADFSDALMWLKEGKRVARAGWNAGGQWVRMWSQPYAAHTWEDDDFCYAVEPGLVLKNAQNQLVQWVPSMGDLLATDWLVVR